MQRVKVYAAELLAKLSQGERDFTGIYVPNANTFSQLDGYHILVEQLRTQSRPHENYPIFDDASISRLNVPGIYLPFLRARGANLRGAVFDGAYITEAEMDGAKLNRASFTDARLNSTDFSKISAAGADFTGASMEKTCLFGANLDYATMVKTYLRGAEISWAKVRHANLTKADLTGADLFHTTFFESDLTGADFSRAKLTGTVFKGTRRENDIFINSDTRHAVGL